MWHQGFNRNFTKILFVCNSSPQVTVFRNFGDYPTTYSALFAFSRQRTHAECKQRWFNFWDTLQNGGRRWIGEKSCWINRVIIVFFVYKKYSRCFVKLRLNPWCHMDYFTDVLATFLCVDSGNILSVYIWRVRELSDSIKNILICVPKMNDGFTVLEQHEGE